MDQLSAGQWFCLLFVALLVVGGVLTTFARAHAARKTGKWPEQ